jgi:hypothetical protein
MRYAAQRRTTIEEAPASRRITPAEPHAVLAAQRGHGNAWVARTLARLKDEARDAFVGRGVRGMEYEPPTGLGGFNVSYDPVAERLDVTLRIGFDFAHALRIDSAGVVTAESADFDSDALAVMATIADPAARAVEVNTNWRWTPGDDAAWMQRFAQVISDTWGEQHWFVSDRWPDLHATVNVVVDARVGQSPNDHCVATVAKVPAGSTSGPTVSVGPDPGPQDEAAFTSATLDHVEDWKHYTLQFATQSADIRGCVSAGERKNGELGTKLLDMLIADLQPATAGGGVPITLTGRVSTAEGHLDLARARADAVRTYLATGIDPSRILVAVEGDRGAGADQSWQRVDIEIGDGRGQRTIAHEAGHMFGLDDEYASPAAGMSPGTGTDGAVGGVPLHGMPPFAGRGIPPARVENNDGIMSIGNVVQAQHYVTFLDALNQLAAPEAFSYGGAGAAPRAGGAGRFETAPEP